MVLLHFPHALTEEEQMLQSKFAKLRKKKKQLEASKNPHKNENDKSGVGPSGIGIPSDKRKVPEAKDAKEVAKKLIRTGAITDIQKAIEKNKAEQNKGFKRSQGECPK